MVKNNMANIENEKIWYNTPSPEQDVVISTRVRLSRNLASFPFPSNFNNDDSERVQSIIFDAFNKIENPDNYQSLELKFAKSNAHKILAERGFCSLQKVNKGTGIVSSIDGATSCLINEDDHIKISSFQGGLNLEKSYEYCSNLDFMLQDYIQFAASRDFGFLNSSVFNTGSGLKASVRLHLPSLSHSGAIKDVIKDVQLRGFVVSDCFGVGSFFNSSLGAYFNFSTTSCFNGNEIDQLASVSSIAKYICDIERKKRQFYADNKSTIAHNIVVRAFSLAKFSIMLELRDSIDIISCLKWGLDLGYIAGIEDYELNALLYSIQPGHLGFLLETGKFSFEEDIANDENLTEQRLRAIVIKKEVDKIKFVS